MSAQDITRALGGKWHGRHGLARCPAHEDRTPSLSLSDGHDGRLLARCHAGCDWPEIREALKAAGAVEGRSHFRLDPAEAARRMALEKAELAKRSRQGDRCWDEAEPIAGTLADDYLRGRGITCNLPDTLRFHPSCWHAATAQKRPAMVARVEGADRFAVHRTYLDTAGRKADVSSPKAMLGSVKGGAVRLSGASRRLVVAEGIETALSLPCGLLDGPMSLWAALSASGMAGLRLPGQAGALIVATDGEATGRDAGRELANRASGMGWTVSILDPGDGLDWNDVLCSKGAR